MIYAVIMGGKMAYINFDETLSKFKCKPWVAIWSDYKGNTMSINSVDYFPVGIGSTKEEAMWSLLENS